MAKAILRTRELTIMRPAGPLLIRLIRRPGVRCLRLTVENGGAVRVSVPVRLSWDRTISLVEDLLRQRQDWLDRAIARAASSPIRRLFALGRPDYLAQREAARILVSERLEVMNRHYGFDHGRISIRNQRTRWGSASRNGRLSFNYRLVYLPPALVDYVVVHELCHLKEPNHGKGFWDLVARTVPDHRRLRAALRQGRFD